MRELSANLKYRHLRRDPFHRVETSAFNEDPSDHVFEKDSRDGHGPCLQGNLDVKMFELRCDDTDLSYTTQPRKADELVFETKSSCTDEGINSGRPGVVLTVCPTVCGKQW